MQVVLLAQELCGPTGTYANRPVAASRQAQQALKVGALVEAPLDSTALPRVPIKAEKKFAQF